ncbi:MAG: hypothetical protein AB1486_24330 [Planctomycetota bacterium]
MRYHHLASTLATALVFEACSATHLEKEEPGLRAYQAGAMAEARDTFRELAKETPDDRHLFQLEEATANLGLGDVEAATASFSEAIARLDSLRGEDPLTDLTSLLLDDTVRNYAGSPYEQTMARIFWAFAYLLGAGPERMENVSAVCRDLDGKMESIEAYYNRAYPYDGDGNASQFSFQIPPLGKYLAALAAAHRGELDSAEIYMKQAQAGLPDSGFLREEIRRMRRARHADDRVVLIVALAGMAPRKVEVVSEDLTGALQGMKALYYSLNPHDDADIFLNAVLTAPVVVTDIEPPEHRWHAGFIVTPQGGEPVLTERLADIDAYARQEFDSLRSAMLTRAGLRRLLKEVGGQVGAKQAHLPVEVGSGIASIFSATETADLRGWYTLPRDIQVAHLTLPSAVSSITLMPRRPGGAPMGPEVSLQVDLSNADPALILVFHPDEGTRPIVLLDASHRAK